MNTNNVSVHAYSITRKTKNTFTTSKNKQIQHAKIAGFTLLELLTTLAIAAILISLAIPSFGTLINNNRLTTTNNELITALKLARTLSITHSQDTYICEITDNQQCNTKRPFNADWSRGWMVFIDTNRNGKLDNSDNIQLIKERTINNQVAIIFNQRGRLRFRADGSSRSAGFYLCSDKQNKHIYLLYSGRARFNETLTPKQQKICRKKLKKSA